MSIAPVFLATPIDPHDAPTRRPRRPVGREQIHRSDRTCSAPQEAAVPVLSVCGIIPRLALSVRMRLCSCQSSKRTPTTGCPCSLSNIWIAARSKVASRNFYRKAASVLFSNPISEVIPIVEGHLRKLSIYHRAQWRRLVVVPHGGRSPFTASRERGTTGSSKARVLQT